MNLLFSGFWQVYSF